MSKLKKALWIILGISLLLIVVYLGLSWASYEGLIEKEKFWDYFKKWSVIVVLGILGATGITYIILNKILDRKKDKKDGSELPKEYVDSHPAIKTWVQAFIKHTFVPAYIDYSTEPEGEIKAKNDAVDVTYTKEFSHDITGVARIEFEVVAKAGKRKGINFVIIKLDQGLEKIKTNWNSYLSPHTTHEMHRHSNRYTPLATAQDQNTRLQLALLKDGDGIGKEELEQLEKFKVRSQPVTTTELSEEEQEKLNRKKELEENLQQKSKK